MSTYQLKISDGTREIYVRNIEVDDQMDLYKRVAKVAEEFKHLNNNTWVLKAYRVHFNQADFVLEVPVFHTRAKK